MRIISKRILREFWTRRPDSRNELTRWYRLVSSENWKSPAGVKQRFGARADFVSVRSRNTVTVFDIANNRYRLIAAIHYNRGIVYVLRVLTHAEYDLNDWKNEL